jgi:hypothetical protein
MYIGLHVNYRYSCQTAMLHEFSRFKKTGQMSNFVIFLMGAELFHQTDRQSQHEELPVAILRMRRTIMQHTQIYGSYVGVYLNNSFRLNAVVTSRHSINNGPSQPLEAF